MQESTSQFQHNPVHNLTSVSPPNLVDQTNVEQLNKSANSDDHFVVNNEKLRRSSTFSMSPSQSLYYSISSDGDTVQSQLTPSSANALESRIGNNKEEALEVGVLREKNGYWEGVFRHEANPVTPSCSKQLFAPEKCLLDNSCLKKVL